MYFNSEYQPDFLKAPAAQRLQDTLTAHVCWQHESVTMFGKTHTLQRRSAWFGDAGIAYRYSGQIHEATGWPSYLETIRDQIRSTLPRRKHHPDKPFNFVLANFYDHGHQAMGWHRDNEPEIHPLIASVSLGSPRRFRLEGSYLEPAESQAKNCSGDAIVLEHGSLLLFDGRRRHCLPKMTKVVDPRINLTFRTII